MYLNILTYKKHLLPKYFCYLYSSMLMVFNMVEKLKQGCRFCFSNIGILLGILTVIGHGFAMYLCPESFYKFYENVVFPIIRTVYDYTLGFLPFPFVYIVFVFLIYLLYFGFQKIFKPEVSFFGKCMKIIIGVTNFFGWVVFIFYFSWGFNYYQPSIEKQLSLPEITLDSADIVHELNHITSLVNQARTKLSSDTSALVLNLNWTELEDSIRVHQEGLISTWGKSVQGRVRIRALRPKGLLLRFSTAGVYIPFAFEGHVDPGNNAIQWPFTLAHEMAHGYGYTDEGVCNFIGFLTCMHSHDSVIKYSGLLGYWRYIFFDIRSRYPEIAKQTYEKLTKGVQNDLKSIRNDLNKYPDIMPILRDKIYDSYLKSHGVTSGLQSYNEITMQVLRWKKSKYAFPITAD